MKKSNYFVYMLECSDGSYYTGYTSDLGKRVKRHNEGFASKYTRSRLPVKVVWKKEYKYFKKAIKAENKIKKLTRRQKEQLVKGMRLDKVLAKSGPGKKLQGKSLRHLPCSPRTRQPKVFIKTFGCQMNKRDTEIVKDVLSNGDFVFTDKENEADIILYNTCSVREHAEDRVIGKMGQLSKRKEDRRKTRDEKEIARSKTKNQNNKNKDAERKVRDENRPILGIIGCMAKIHGDKLFDKIPGLDLICSPSNIYNLKEDLEKILSKETKIKDVKKKDFLNDKYKHHEIRGSQVSAWVSIMEGCENFCSYCVVPYARGKEVSRPADDIINEIKKLIDRGFKEVTLLGQNVNSYKVGVGRKTTDERRWTKNKDENRKPQTENRNDFVELLQRVNDETGIRRIRFTTNHPKDTSDELFKAMRDLDKVCPHLHLAMQSGSDKILKLMNRGYTYEKFKSLVDNLKSTYPECNLTTDIIVGFPGESNEDFMQTYRTMEAIRFDSAFIFKYSPRPRTAASKLKDDVPLEVKKMRNQKLLQLQDEICLEKNKKYLNKKVEVLVEEETDKKIYLDTDTNYDKKYIGRTPDNRLVFFMGGKGLVGKEVEVKVLNTTTHSIIGLED